MVSTRAIKLKFFEGERVLCYEPDPTKAKVLYDSKVRDVIFHKDDRARKNSIEYLIHFQGWNSSWDRCVSEEFVLKDTPENRQLQKELAEKSQLQLGAYLYRKDRKKSRKPCEGETSEDGDYNSPVRMNNDDIREEMSASDDSSMEDETIIIELTPYLRGILENDYYLIKEKNKVPKLPATPNIVAILESYYRNYARSQIDDITEKSNPKYRPPPVYNYVKLKPEDVQRNLTMCREVLDGLRIYFDFTLNDLLLYKQEKGLCETKPPILEPFITENNQRTDKPVGDYLANLSNLNWNNNGHFNQNGVENRNARRRTLRSNRSSHPNGSSSPGENNWNNIKQGPSNVDLISPIAKVLLWRLLPDKAYSLETPPPCLVYGATHLLRLFVKLPELLMDSEITEDKLKVLLRHIDSLIDFLNEQKDLYGEQFYTDTFS